MLQTFRERSKAFLIKMLFVLLGAGFVLQEVGNILCPEAQASLSDQSSSNQSKYRKASKTNVTPLIEKGNIQLEWDIFKERSQSFILPNMSAASPLDNKGKEYLKRRGEELRPNIFPGYPQETFSKNPRIPKKSVIIKMDSFMKYPLPK